MADDQAEKHRYGLHREPLPRQDPVDAAESSENNISDDAAYWKAEATKAFRKRDELRSEFEALKGRAKMSEEERAELDELRAARKAAEEKRQIEAGEFDKAREALINENAKEKAAREAAERRYADKVVETAFHGASSLFGPDGLTTLTPEFAFSGFRSHVEFVPGENGRPDRMVVKDRAGEIIRDERGDPMSFTDGMKRLIDTWPAKEQILRSAGRAGSGSSGASGDAIDPATRAELAERANRGDRAALAELRKTKPKTGTTRGRYWERQAAARAAQG